MWQNDLFGFISNFDSPLSFIEKSRRIKCSACVAAICHIADLLTLHQALSLGKGVRNGRIRWQKTTLAMEGDFFFLCRGCN